MLTVFGLVDKRPECIWGCICDCGGIIFTRVSRLHSGSTTSCGCYRNAKLIKMNYKTGLSKERLYNIWAHMKRRCYNKHDSAYRYYGEKGIRVCDDWRNDFLKFRTWALTNGYQNDLTIERINNNGNYEPSNCTWIPWNKQGTHTCRIIYVVYNGKKYTLKQIAEEIGIHYSTVLQRRKSKNLKDLFRRRWTQESKYKKHTEGNL